jgi:hypothetical protein
VRALAMPGELSAFLCGGVEAGHSRSIVTCGKYRTT